MGVVANQIRFTGLETRISVTSRLFLVSSINDEETTNLDRRSVWIEFDGMNTYILRIRAHD